MSKYKGRKIGTKKLKPESMMMSYGYDPTLSEGAIKCPIFQTSTFVFKTAEDGKAFFELALGLREKGPTEELGLIYSRLNNPDLEILEDRLTLWDEGDEAAVFQSGMAAITTSLLAFLRPGDVLLHSDPLYGGTDYLIKHYLPQFGIDVVGFPAGVPTSEVTDDVRRRVNERRVPVVLIETPANPTNRLVDIAGTVALARSLGSGGDVPVVMVDNTFLGPLFQHPLKHGADLVLYSATKFLGGHSDVVAGACIGREDVVKRILTLRTFMGTAADPWTGWLLLRSLETLKMRMTAQMKNAQYVAAFLAEHPKVRRVEYLGLLADNDPMYPVYRKQCLAAGSLIAFEIDGGEKEAFAFLNALQLVSLAVSLGGTESLAEHPASMTHADVSPEDRVAMGITPALVRLSVGVEHYEDLIADMEQALGAVGGGRTVTRAKQKTLVR
ncbi:MAG: cystathionine gamma-synthase family protein [Gemmatimonadota bacterium]|nr:cystathionine gamma-synthase family protein [Gemmatimonadota bacterium]MDH3367319.1 cystathionine gamma-synthase family protein [Gemmatimonadota bacterium]MDH3476764.1 cystathionine gamma-synthase family protein [Gemmatimonadota bacterium]MDH3568648.1 cystathionine gamma-synthase family protein [Gemmatimonadota bacterium]MDH5551158.1 cystathionine gamma-synthase family protein [Gemmatimonadota bacterium]